MAITLYLRCFFVYHEECVDMILDYSGTRQEAEDFVLGFLHQKMENVNAQQIIHMPLDVSGQGKRYEMTWYSSYESNDDYGFLVGVLDQGYTSFYVTADESRVLFYEEILKAIHSVFGMLSEAEREEIYMEFLEQFTVDPILQ